MKIETYIHGSSGDKALWAALGPFLCDRKVIKDLGGPIYSAPGVHWFVAYDGDRVVGFASMRLAPQAVWHDYGYVVPDRRSTGVFTALAKTRDREAAHESTPARSVICAPRWKHYKARGWKIATKRGQWFTITREKP
jgi:hypothetical protein